MYLQYLHLRTVGSGQDIVGSDQGASAESIGLLQMEDESDHPGELLLLLHPEGVPFVQGPEEAGGAGQGAHGRDHDPELLSPVQAVHLLQTDDPRGSGHPERVPELLREQAVQEGADQQPKPDGTGDQL